MRFGSSNTALSTSTSLDGLHAQAYQDAAHLVRMYEYLIEHSPVGTQDNPMFEGLLLKAANSYGSAGSADQVLATTLYQDYIFSKVNASSNHDDFDSSSRRICRGLRYSFLQFILKQESSIWRAFNRARATWGDRDHAPSYSLRNFKLAVDALALAQGMSEPRLTHKQKFDFLIPTLRRVVAASHPKDRISPAQLEILADSLIDLLTLN